MMQPHPYGYGKAGHRTSPMTSAQRESIANAIARRVEETPFIPYRGLVSRDLIVQLARESGTTEAKIRAGMHDGDVDALSAEWRANAIARNLKPDKITLDERGFVLFGPRALFRPYLGLNTPDLMRRFVRQHLRCVGGHFVEQEDQVRRGNWDRQVREFTGEGLPSSVLTSANPEDLAPASDYQFSEDGC